jgi:hypothetical protein
MSNSSWQETRSSSKYHFDTQTHDPRWDCVQYLGRFSGSWDQELEQAKQRSAPATWATRGYKSQTADIPTQDLEKEHHDLDTIGMARDSEITDLDWKIEPVFQRMVDLFVLENSMTRLHIQRPGQVWNLHIDKLSKWCPENPERVIRIMIQLEDWKPGHFWQYGNHNHSGWYRGDITTFDWQNVPHCTANAGHVPRCTLQITGVRTASTQDFIDYLANCREHLI